MRKKVFLIIGFLAFLVPPVFSAENPGLDSSGGSGSQKNPLNVAFSSAKDFLSNPALAAPGNGPFGGEALPVLISMSKPILYPGWARRKGSEGLLVVALEVLEDGTVGRWQIVRSTGEESLDKSAIKTFRSWKFQPAMKNGKPVKTCIQVPINFELTEE